MPRLTPATLDTLEAAHKKGIEVSGYIERADYERIYGVWDALPALIAAARLTVPEPISDRHKDGNWWLVWFPNGKQWYKARWDGAYQWWQVAQDTVIPYGATRALPIPEAPDA